MRALKSLGTLSCLFAAFLAAVWQFKASSLLPLVLPFLFIIPIRWLRPSWFRRALIVPAAGFALLLIDAYALQHRIAVKLRVWHPVFNITHVVETFDSPSGRTRVYLMESCWADSFYFVYVSAGGLFPLSGQIVSMSESVPRRELIAGWQGSFFTIGHRIVSYVYDEREGKGFSYYDWMRGPLHVGDAPRTVEGFSAYIKELRSQAERAEAPGRS